MFWPEVSRWEDVEWKDVWIYDGLICLWSVSDTTWNIPVRKKKKKSFKRLFFSKKKINKKNLCLKWLLNYSPMTSSFTSFHSKSFPASWAMVTVILLWMPCEAKRGRKKKCFLFTPSHDWTNRRKANVLPLSIQDEGKHMGLTWCKRNVPWQGIPPRWSTTAGM